LKINQNLIVCLIAAMDMTAEETMRPELNEMPSKFPIRRRVHYNATTEHDRVLVKDVFRLVIIIIKH